VLKIGCAAGAGYAGIGERGGGEGPVGLPRPLGVAKVGSGRPRKVCEPKVRVD
jgi:hypothetical protein